MTYCLGLMVSDGLVLLADGRVTAGSQVSNARKATRHGPEGAQVAIMTSGLRSLRDKTLAFFDRAQRKRFPNGHGAMLSAVESYCQCLREVAEQDREALEKSDLQFNLHAIVAGQLEDEGADVQVATVARLNHAEVTTLIGRAGDETMTPLVLAFFAGCFDEGVDGA